MEPPYVPEIAFFGRSNAGKSTLLAALSIRGVNVRVSERPGTTNTLDWFEYKGRGAFEKGTVRLVDLPGYGFAFAYKEVQRQWHGLTEKFFRTRHRVLKRVMLLIDARYGIKELDSQVMATLFECRVPFQIVMNKCDIVSVEDLVRRATKVQDQLEEFLPVVVLPILMVSAKSRVGLEAIQREIANILQLRPEDVTKDSMRQPALLGTGATELKGLPAAGEVRRGLAANNKKALASDGTAAKQLTASSKTQLKGRSGLKAGTQTAARAKGKQPQPPSQGTMRTPESKRAREKRFGKVRPTRKQRAIRTKNKNLHGSLDQEDLYES